MFQNYIDEIIFDNELEQYSYLNDLPVIRCLAKSNLKLSKQVTVFVGENGTGKLTLLEGIAIAYGFNAEGGSKNFNFTTNDTHSELYEHLTLGRPAFPEDDFFLRAESFYNVATNIDRIGVGLSYGGSLHRQSHGESFLALVQNRFRGKGLYILDEPEAALSPIRCLTLIAEMARLTEDDSQFIIATHSPMFMAFPEAEVLEFSEEGIRRVDYRETEHFKTLKAFIDNPERLLHYLFIK